MTIHTLHGIVDVFYPYKQTCRNYVSRDSLKDYLLSRVEPYTTWKGDATQGDVITVDDSTHAGANACMLIRSFGYPVIFFVNPWQVVTGENYFFSILDSAIDNRRSQDVFFNGLRFDLRDAVQVQKFRKHCKNLLMILPAAEAVTTVSTTIAELLNSDDIGPPEHTRPVSLCELHALKNIGVRIESHGWSHRNISAFTNEDLLRDLCLTSDWLKNELSIEASLYAVPFGFPDIPVEVRKNMKEEYFLLEDKMPAGKSGTKCWNRLDLSGCLKNK